MPLVQRMCSAISARFSRRLSTKASRFSLAVSTGFVIAVVAVASTGFGRAGFADGLFDLFGGSSFFGQPQAQPQPQYGVQGGQASYQRAHRHFAHRAIAAKVHLAKSSDDDTSSEETSRHLAGKSICVRLCDGYAFPVGDYHGTGDRSSHEATCHSECPGAETALYVMPSGSDSIGDAVRVGSSRNYSELPDAFHYSTVLDDACTCHPAEGNRIKSLLHDFTLRRGDAVMTATGFKVFHGAAEFPFRRKDFVALAKSRDIRKADRGTFKAIERASLPATSTVAQRSTPSPADSARRDSTKQLEHQASR